MKKSLITSLITGFLTLPILAFAQEPAVHTEPYNANLIAKIMLNLLTPVWQFFAGIAIIMFVVAGILFVTSSGDPGKLTTARQAVIWGVVGIIVAILAFSVLTIVGRAVGV
jgi:FtsH-binding integral membrane protein